MSLVESTYFSCESCGKKSIRVLFAPWVRERDEVIAFCERNKEQYESEKCEVWLIGPPTNHNDEDCFHLTTKIWPSLERSEIIRPSKFREHIAYMEENHCNRDEPVKTGIEDFRAFSKAYGFGNKV